MWQATLVLLFFISSSLTEETLRLIHVAFRHGQRTPVDTYPSDPYINYTFSPYGRGALTNEGKSQQYELGIWLRQRYDSFLGQRYTTDLMKAQTTDVDRTKMSAALMLAGLFPPVGDQVWSEQLLWQPIPTSHQRLSEDKLLLVRGCPRYSEAVGEVKSKEAANEIAKQKELYQYLSEHSGRKVSDPEDVMDIYGTLIAEEQFGLKLPEWTNKVFPLEMAKVTAFNFVVNSYTDELKRLKGGPLLKQILEDSKNKINDESSERKLYIYAGHDSTIANLMQALKVWESQIPIYNILAIIEMHKINNEYGVKVFLRNSTNHEPHLLTIPGCSAFCPMDKLITLITPMIPKNLEKECLAKKSDYKAPLDSGP